MKDPTLRRHKQVKLSFTEEEWEELQVTAFNHGFGSVSGYIRFRIKAVLISLNAPPKTFK